MKNVLISEENLEIANSLLKSCYNYFRETASVTLPSEINLYFALPRLATAGKLLPSAEGVEVIDVSIPRKLLLWAYTLFHGHCGSISQVVKYMEENTKPKMKRGASTSSVVPSVQSGGNNEPEAAPKLVQVMVSDSMGGDSCGSTSAPV